MRNLVDMQRKVEWKQKRGRERQLLRVRRVGVMHSRITCNGGNKEPQLLTLDPFTPQVQERLSIVQTRKAEEDLLGLKHEERLRHLTHDLPQV